jgi:hypothetical protein
MKNVIHEGNIVFNPIEHKIPMPLKMNLSVSECVQMRIIAWLQAARNIGQALFSTIKV